MSNKIRDGKNAFYRRLNLDKDEKKLLRWYRQISRKMKNDSEEKK